MKLVITAFAIAVFSSFAFGQSRTNDDISRQVRSLRAEKAITVSYDSGGNSSKVMAVTDNFSDGEAHAAGLLAMNFAMGFFYPGNELKQSPSEVHLAFWVMAKKPRFAEAHSMKITSGNEVADLGEARYAVKPREDMEYLNFSISLADLAKLSQPGAKIQLGNSQFTITSQQANTIRGLLTVCSF